MNPFDQFDSAPVSSQESANPFDQFDEGAKPKKQNKGILGDIGTGLKRGVEQMPGMVSGIADIAAAPVSAITGVNRPFSKAADYIGEKTGFQPGKWAEQAAQEYSPEMQQSLKNVEQADGFTGTLKAIGENPRSAVNLIAESLPSTLAGGILARGAMGAVAGAEKLAAMKAAGDTAGLMKAGAIAGGIGEGAVTAGQQMSQTDYNVDPLRAAGSALAAGVGTGIIGGISGRVANKIGLADIEGAIAAGTLGAGKKAGVGAYAGRIAGGAVQEGALEELPQSAQEQVWQNLANGKPWNEGVGKASAQGLVAGMAMGAGVNALPGSSGKQEAAPPIVPPASDSINLITDPGPLQGRIDSLLGIGDKPMSDAQRAQYAKDLEASFGEVVGYAAGANGLEVPVTMEDYLRSTLSAADMTRDKPLAVGANDQSANRLNQLADEESTQQPDIAPAARGIAAAPVIPVVGPLSAVANMAVQSGAHQATVMQQAAAQAAQNEPKPEGKAGTPVGAQKVATAPAQGPMTEVAGQTTNVATPAGDPFIQSRSDAQLNWLAERGKPELKAAAVAEIQKRAGSISESVPALNAGNSVNAPATTEQSSPVANEQQAGAGLPASTAGGSRPAPVANQEPIKNQSEQPLDMVPAVDAVSQPKTDAAPEAKQDNVPASTLQPDPALQNRDRGRAASVNQMQSIARNPDYMRLGPSRTPDSGAPMVFAVGNDTQKIAPANFGANDTAVMSDGQRVPFRYAVVDASQVQPSNFADSATNPEFASTTPGTIKALNNGRTAGVRSAHSSGNATTYTAELLADGAHGVAPEAIRNTPNPMLVRVYAEQSNTGDIAAKSQGQGLGMSASERATQDAELMTSDVLDKFAPGDIASAGNRDFVRSFVGKLAANDVADLMDAGGNLSQDGRRRIEAALLTAAYGKSDLVQELFESTDTDIKAIGNALKVMSGQWAAMRQAAKEGSIDPATDMTANLIEAVNIVRRSRAEGSSIAELAGQGDLMGGNYLNELSELFLRIFYKGKNYERARGGDKVIAALQEIVTSAMSTKADAGLFGDSFKATPKQIVESARSKIDEENKPASQSSLFGANGQATAVSQGNRSESAAQPGEVGSRPVGTGSSQETGKQAEPVAKAAEQAPELTPIAFVHEGDFWNYYGDRAKEIAQAIGVTVMKRNGKPMLGFPDGAKDLMRADMKAAGFDATFEGELADAKEQDEAKLSPRERGAADFAAGRERVIPDDLRGVDAIAYNQGYAEAKIEADYIKSRDGKEIIVRPSEFPTKEVDASYSHISHNGTSRARSDRDAFIDVVNSRYDEAIGKAETSEQKAAAKHAAIEFKDEYLRHLQPVIRVRGQTYSGFIAGRANLNAKQANSRNDALSRALDTFAAWQRGAEPKIMQAVLDARNDDQRAAERKAKDDKAAKRYESLKNNVSALLNFTKVDGSKFGTYPVAKVSIDRDGYPSSVTVEATDLTDNKFDIAKTLFGGDKVKLRAVVDEIRADKAVKTAKAGQAPRQYNTMADVDSAIVAIHDGAISPEEYKAAFNGLMANKDAIVAELGKMTITQLHERFGKQPYGRPEKKGEIIERAFEAVRNTFSLRREYGRNSYSMGPGQYEKYLADNLKALTDLVNASTAEDLKAFADEIGQTRAARQEKVEAAQDPKTIEDFDNALRLKKAEGMSFAEGRMSLTPEQRAEYDRLKGIATRDQRKARADQQKTDVRVASQTTGAQIVEGKHSKQGYALWSVQLADRVDGESYKTLLSTAKRMGGNYVNQMQGRMWKTVWGFQFKDQVSAEAFMKLAAGDKTEAEATIQEHRDAFADDRSQSAVERLSEMAGKLEDRADESLGRERKANTERRARFAASAESAANAEKAMATTMRRIASAISDGTAQFLDRVRQKAQIEYLTATLRTAKGIELRTKYPSYGEQQRHEGEPATGETADYAEFPQYAMMRSDLANLARKLVTLPNMKLLGQRILKVADDTSTAYNAFAKEHLLEVSKFGKADGSGWATFSTLKDAERSIEASNLAAVAVPLQIKRGEYRIVLSPSEAINRGIWKGDDRKIFLSPEVGEEIVEKLGRLNRKHGQRRSMDAPPEAPWQFENAYNNRKRLAGLGIEQPWEFRAALREFANLKEAPKEADKIKAMERAMIGRKNDGLDFFPTPAETARAMIDAAEITEGMSVLEPSAGMGHIAEQVRDVAGIDPDVIEFNSERRELLEAKGFNVVGNDFMEISPRGFTYGDVFKDEAGVEGVMRGSGGLGSNRVGFVPLGKDASMSEWRDRDELTGVRKNGLESGYDRIIMNPPFSNRRDAEHVQHAYSLLKPGGRLVAIMGEGVFFGQDKKAVAFREWLDEVGGTSEKLEEGTFLDPSLPVNTSTNARMVVVEKPEGAAAPADNEGAGNIAAKGSISPADKAIYGMAAEGKSAAEVLKFIASASRSPFNRQVARLLLKTGIAPSVTVGDSKTWKIRDAKSGEAFAAAYDPKTDTVALFRPASSERNMLHELVHAATIKALSKKGMASAQMKALFAHVEKTGKLTGMYGIRNVDEFIAESFSNPKFQAMLKQVSAAPVGGKPSSAWDWFIRVVRGILGLKQGQDNALSQALDIGIGVMRENMRLNEGTGDVRYNAAPGKINQTDTEAFKRWFGDSKVVDSDGKPLVVYHGSGNLPASFSADQRPERYGMDKGSVAFFTENPRTAASYANNRAAYLTTKTDGKRGVLYDGAAVAPVYLSFQNPLVVDAQGANFMAVPFEGIKRNRPSVEDIAKIARERGHDGLIVHNIKDNAPGVNTMATTYVSFSPTQIKSSIGNNGQFDGSNPDIRYNVADEGWSVSEPSKLDDVIYAMQDKQVDMKRVMQSIMKTGKQIKDGLNPYLQEELFHGRASKGVKDFLDFELRPLLKEMQQGNIDMGDFEEYLWNAHAQERNEQIARVNPEMKDGGSGIKTADAKAYLAALSPELRGKYQALAARVNAINKASQKALVDSGLEKQETIDAWNGAYQHYVPLQREDVDSGHIGTGKGFSIRGSSTKRALGSGRKVVDIIANLTMQRERNIVRAEKNRVTLAVRGLAMDNPNADFWTVDEAPKERVIENKAIYTVKDSEGRANEFTRMADAEKFARSVPGVNIEQTWQDRVTERVVPGFSSRDNVLLARVNGEDKYVIFNERDARAMRMVLSLKNLDMDNMGRVLSLVGKATRYLSAINTQYNPVFGVINLIRDTQGALVNLSSTPLAGEQKRVLGYTTGALIGIYKDIRAHRQGKVPSSNWAALFEEFQKEGGQTGYRDQYANAEARAESIISELKQIKEGKPKQMLRGVFGWLSDYNDTMENAVRLAAYKAAKEKGMSKQQAASLAKNLTVNFNRKGQVATQVGALYAFFNASMQGSARLAQTLFEANDGDIKSVRLSKTGKKILTGGLMLGSMQALLLAAAGFDDDEPPEFVRERNLILPIGDGKYLTLAMPLGLHVIPGIGRIATEFVLGGGKDPLKHMAAFAGMFAESFNPIGSAGFSLQTIAPSVIDPFAALAENRDFTGKEIYRENRNPMSPTPGHARAKDVATIWSRYFSEGLNSITGGTEFKPGMFSPSPDSIDYLLAQAGGGVMREANKVAQTIGSATTGEDLPLYKIPLVGRFVGDTAGQSGESAKFYDAIKQINMHENQMKGLREERRFDEAREYAQENPAVRLIMAGNHAERSIQKLRSLKRDLIKNDADQSRVKEIDERITASMKSFNERAATVF